MFQMSGQGPYYGQAVWFKRYHAERVPSAEERYVKEIKRLSGVLEDYLKKQKEEGKAGKDGPWLVGGKMSYADLAFLPWQVIVKRIFPADEFDLDAFPEVRDWIQRMYEKPGVKEVVDEHIYSGPS
jgi:glutathione S-transferase